MAHSLASLGGQIMTPGTLALDDEDFQFLDGAFLEALGNFSILLTGGTGFLGSWLLEYLYRRDRSKPLGLRIQVLSRNPSRFLAANPHYATWPALTMVEGDVRALDRLAVPADWIIHAASPSGLRPEECTPLGLIDTIVKGTEEVLKLARRCGTRRFLLVSTGLASGLQPQGVSEFREDQMGWLGSLDDFTTYGNAKHFAEHLSFQFGRTHGIEVTFARCFAFVGPLLPLGANYAIGNFIRDGLAGSPIRVLSDGTPLRSYLYASELSHWLWSILIKGKAGRAYNVGSGTAVSLGELAGFIGQTCGVPVHIAQKPNPDAIPTRYVPCVKRAQEELGLVPILDWQAAVNRTLTWHWRQRSGARG